MIEAELRKLPKDVTIVVNLHLTREYRFRRWIATQLIKLAAMVLGCGIEVEE